MKYWEIVADKLSAAGSLGAIAPPPRRMAGAGVTDAYRGDGRRFIVESDELLTV